MRNIIKKIIKSSFNKLKKSRLWIRLVIKEHNSYKLSIYHKLRAIKYGFSSDFYRMYNLEKNNPKDYISEYKRVLSRDINQQYKIIFDNKLVFEKIFSQYVKIPKNILVVLDKLYDDNGNEVEKVNLEKVLCKEKYILKPAADSGGGIGVSLIIKEQDRYNLNGKKLTSDDLYYELLKNKGYIINDYIIQHAYSNKINPNSVNTIRIITIKNPKNGEIIIPCAVHRFGSQKSGVVDNVSRGGYVSWINLAKGVIENTACGIDVKFVDIHPDTGVKIYGTKIPHWNEVTTTLLRIAKMFQYIPFIAWDIVITEEGFAVIEINASSSLELFQVFGSIKNTDLGDFYESYGYFKSGE